MKHTHALRRISRRRALGLMGGLMGGLVGGAAGMPFAAARADAPAVAERIRAVTGGIPAAKTGLVTLELPEIAENGHAVKIGFAVDSPMTDDDHIRAVHIFADGNPRPDVAGFNFTPACGECRATTRMRLARSQNVVVIAEKGDGTFHMAEAAVTVTVGGCVG